MRCSGLSAPDDSAMATFSAVVGFVVSPRYSNPLLLATFSAELCSVDDASSIGLLIRGMFAEIVNGPMSASALARKTDCGDLGVELEIGTDNRGLFNGATAVEIKIPSEPHLLYLLKALRDRLDSKSIDALWWFDTRDMICDAMTKGTLPREPLLRRWRTAMLEIMGETPVQWRSSVRRAEGVQEFTDRRSKMSVDTSHP